MSTFPSTSLFINSVEDDTSNSTSLINDRDFKQMNQATSTLQANVLALIGKESLQTLRDDLISETTEGSTTEKINRQIKLVDVTLVTNDSSRDLFNGSQKNVNKTVIDRYSSSQHNLMVRSTACGENIIKVQGLSSCVTSPTIANLYKTILNKKDQQPIAPSNTPINIPITTTAAITTNTTVLPTISPTNVPISSITTSPTEQTTEHQITTTTNTCPTTTSSTPPSLTVDCYLSLKCTAELPSVPPDFEFN